MNAESFEPQVSPPVRRRPRLRAGDFLFVLTATGLAARGQVGQWSQPGGGAWNDTNNWRDGVRPNAAGATAIFGPGIQNPATITLGSPTRVGGLVLTASNSISVNGTAANRLIFASSPPTREALLEVTRGSHSVTHLGLESNLHVDVFGGGTVSWHGSLTGTDRTVRKTGDGLLDLNTPLMNLTGFTRGLWDIEGGRVRFGGTLGGNTVTNSGRLRLAGGTVEFAGSGFSVLTGGWAIDGPGGTVEVGGGSSRLIQVTGPLTGAGPLTKTGTGVLALTPTGGSAFTGDFSFQDGIMAVTGYGQAEFVLRGDYADVPGATYYLFGLSPTNRLQRAITFENGRTNVVRAGMLVGTGAKSGVSASGPGTVVQLENTIQIGGAAGGTQNLYLTTSNGGALVLGPGAEVNNYLQDGSRRAAQYWDDGTGELRFAPGFAADYAPSDPGAGWNGLEVYGGTLVSSESQNLPGELTFNASRDAGGQNRWRTENAAQTSGGLVRFNANTRITTDTDLELTGSTIAAGATLTKDGPGTLALEPNPALNNFGPFTGILVEEGTVQIGYQVDSAANLAVDVRPGARLTGDGRMGALAVSGTVAPGRPGQDFASLTAVGILMGGQAAYEVDLGTDPATDVDRLVVDGAILLDGQLNLTLLAEPTPFVQYVIVDNRFGLPVLGTFDQGSSVSADFGGVTYPFDILYNGGDGNDVVLLTLVPEPGAGSLVLLGAGVWLLGRRAARRR